MNCKVSIIIPAYNCEKYIAETLHSCVSQDYDNIEIIVVNDGSTDRTKEIIESFTDSRIILLNQQNCGVSAARNRGLEEAKGEYITFLDSDDTLAQDTISKNMEILQANPEDAWLYFPVQRIDKDGNEVDEISSELLPSYKYGGIERMTASEAFTRMTRRLLPTCVCGGFYRRDFLTERFKEGRFEDTIMVMELLRKHRDIMLSPYGAYIYYDRGGSFINSEWDAKKWTSYVNVLCATMQTKLELFPVKKKEVENEKTRLYYNLRYLKAKNKEDKTFSEPLDHYVSIVGKINPSIFGWMKFAIKTWGSGIVPWLGAIQTTCLNDT